MLGMVVGLIGSYVIQTAMPGPFRAFPMPGSMRGGGEAGGLIVGLVLIPCIAILSLFIGSGIIHLILMLLGGAREGY